MSQRRPAPRRSRIALAAALLALGPGMAAAREPTPGVPACALGPLGPPDGLGDGLIGTLFDLDAGLDGSCPLRPRGPLLASAPRGAAGAGLAASDHGADPTLVGPPPPGGGSAAPGQGESVPRVRAEAPGGPLWGVVSELRGGVLSHDVVFPGMRNLTAPNPFRHHFERGVNVNAEVAFVSPGFLHVLGAPRPRIGGSLNTLGYTSNAYVDLDWRLQLRAGPFFEGFLGGAVHDGKLRNANPRFAELGTRLLFHIGLEAGFVVVRHHGLSLFWEHMSNSALAHKNQGMDSAGLRYGYRFGG